MGIYIKWDIEKLKSRFPNPYLFQDLIDEGVIVEVKTPHGRLISEDEVMARIRQELEGLHFPIEYPDTLEGIFDWITGKTSTVIGKEV